MTHTLRLAGFSDDGKDSKPEKSEPGPFDLFWAMYPRRIGKGAARRAWNGAVDKAGVDTILAATYEYANSPYVKAKLAEGYVPHPSTWLNGERWDDDRAEWGIKRIRGAQAPSVSDEQLAEAHKKMASNPVLLRKIAGMWRSCTGQREKRDDAWYLAERGFLVFAVVSGLKWAAVYGDV